MRRSNIKLLIIGILAGVLGLISKIIYRPLVYYYAIEDFGISDWLPNLFAVIVLCLIAAFLLKKRQIQAMIAICAGIILYEIEQLCTSMVFDCYDIVASLIGLVISIIIFNKFSVKYTPEEEKSQN